MINDHLQFYYVVLDAFLNFYYFSSLTPFLCRQLINVSIVTFIKPVSYIFPFILVSLVINYTINICKLNDKAIELVKLMD